jgi:tetratricopeptide (TPR) repeat protein/predicted phosphodiesterase
MGQGLRIFHISDLHARSNTGPQAERAGRESASRWRVLGKKWDENLEAIREDGIPIDIVAFTGDLADWGHETDYPMGVEFLKRTCAALGVPLERLFVVPGNHDIARETEKKAWSGLCESFRGSGLAGSSWMAGGRSPLGIEEDWRDAILRRQEAFWQAVAGDLGREQLAPWLGPHRRLGYQQRLEVDRRPVWIIGLDTAWLAGDGDKGGLYLTDHQIDLNVSQADGSPLEGFRLALMHHGFPDLSDGKQARRLLADRVDLVLHGHQHDPVVESWAGPDHKLLVLAAGCLYEGDELHRYPNACQVIDVKLADNGRPERVSVRFRGWAGRQGMFWGDDALLYQSAASGRLRIHSSPAGWVNEPSFSPSSWAPKEHETFVGRGAELSALDAALAVGSGARVAVVALQGMPGVGKTYLVEQWCARHRDRFGPLCHWVLDPQRPVDATRGLLELAGQAGLDPDHAPLAEVPELLAARRALVHIDNVDDDITAKAVAELLARLPKVPAIVTGRYTALGTTKGSGWRRIAVECFDVERSVELLRDELGDAAPAGSALRDLAAHVGGLPLALHLAAGYLRQGYTVEAFLTRLRASELSLEQLDPADPLWKERSRGVVSVSFELSRELFLQSVAQRASAWSAGLAFLGWSVASGVGDDLGAAITGFSIHDFLDFAAQAALFSLVRRVPRVERPDGAWSVHPLLAEFLRDDAAKGEVSLRVGQWIATKGNPEPRDRASRWQALSSESASAHAWLASAEPEALVAVVPACRAFAESRGPVVPWLDAVRAARRASASVRPALAWSWAMLARRVGANDEVLEAVEEMSARGASDLTRARAEGLRADLLADRGEVDEALRIRREEALPVYERLGDVRARAVTQGRIADLLAGRGQSEEALRILRAEALPVYERLGDVRERAVTQGKIADLLVDRGEMEEALRIRRDEELPVYEQLGDVREQAVTQGKIAELLAGRGEVEEALRILRTEALPVLERLGDVRARAVTQGQIAGLLAGRGEVEEALRLLRKEALPVFERLGNVRSRAVTQGQIANILASRGKVEEALQILWEEELPVYERLGDVRNRAMTLGKIAELLRDCGEVEEGLRILRDEVLPVLERLGDVRSRAVARRTIAELLAARGEVEEGLRILRDEVLPVLKQLGDVRLQAATKGRIAGFLIGRGEIEEALRIRRDEVLPMCAAIGGRDHYIALVNCAVLFIERAAPGDAVQARRYLTPAAQLAAQFEMVFPERLLEWLASEQGR